MHRVQREVRQVADEPDLAASGAHSADPVDVFRSLDGELHLLPHRSEIDHRPAETVVPRPLPRFVLFGSHLLRIDDDRLDDVALHRVVLAAESARVPLEDDRVVILDQSPHIELADVGVAESLAHRCGVRRIQKIVVVHVNDDGLLDERVQLVARSTDLRDAVHSRGAWLVDVGDALSCLREERTRLLRLVEDVEALAHETRLLEELRVELLVPLGPVQRRGDEGDVELTPRVYVTPAPSSTGAALAGSAGCARRRLGWAPDAERCAASAGKSSSRAGTQRR